MYIYATYMHILCYTNLSPEDASEIGMEEWTSLQHQFSVLCPVCIEAVDFLHHAVPGKDYTYAIFIDV